MDWGSRRKLGSFRIFGVPDGGRGANWVRFAEIGGGGTLGVRELGLFRVFGCWRLIGAGWGAPPVEPGGYIGGCTPAACDYSFWARFVTPPAFGVIPH